MTKNLLTTYRACATAHRMRYAVHNFHSPAIAVDENDMIAAPDRAAFHLPKPLYVADTMEEAEQWREANKPPFQRRDTV